MAIFADRMGKPLTMTETAKKGVNRLFNLVLDLELLIITCAGFVPSHLFRLLIYSLAGIKIGKGSRIHCTWILESPNHILNLLREEYCLRCQLCNNQNS